MSDLRADETRWAEANEVIAEIGVVLAKEMLRDREGTLAALTDLAASDPATWPDHLR